MKDSNVMIAIFNLFASIFNFYVWAYFGNNPINFICGTISFCVFVYFLIAENK